jgi:hypothetical protein
MRPHVTTATKENAVKIITTTLETTSGPTGLFTGGVYIDTVATPSNSSRLSASSVHAGRAHREFGEAAERVRALTDGYGVYSVLEGGGLSGSMETAIRIARPGAAIGDGLRDVRGVGVSGWCEGAA